MKAEKSSVPMLLKLFEAIEQHNLTCLKELLTQGVNPNEDHPRQPSWVPLKAAVEEVSEGGPIEAVVLLLRYGAFVDGGRSPGNATPMIVAMMHGLMEVTRILLAAGADPNVRDIEGDTPLQFSITQRRRKMERLLRLCGAGELDVVLDK